MNQINNEIVRIGIGGKKNADNEKEMIL